MPKVGLEVCLWAMSVMHGQRSAGFCLQHCRVINLVKQLLGPTVQAGAWAELCEQAGCLHGVQARCSNHSQPQTYSICFRGLQHPLAVAVSGLGQNSESPQLQTHPGLCASHVLAREGLRQWPQSEPELQHISVTSGCQRCMSWGFYRHKSEHITTKSSASKDEELCSRF